MTSADLPVVVVVITKPVVGILSGADVDSVDDVDTVENKYA